MDDLRRDQDEPLHALGALAGRLEEMAEHGDMHEDRDAAGVRGLLLVIVAADEQALPRPHDGLRVDLGLLDGGNARGRGGLGVAVVVLIVLHAHGELDGGFAPLVTDDVRGHAQNRPGLDLEEIDGLIAFDLNIIGAGILQRGLHVVHGQHRGTPEHPRLAFGLKSLHPGEEVVGTVRVDGGKVHPRAGRLAHRRQGREAVAVTRELAAHAPALVTPVRALIGHPEIALEIGVDIHDGGMDFHQFHGLVEIADHLGIIGHPVFGVVDEHGVDAGIGHDVDLRGGNGGGLRRCGLLRDGVRGHGGHTALRHEPRAGEFVNSGGA